MPHGLQKPWVAGAILGIALLAGVLVLSRGNLVSRAEAAGRWYWPSWTNPGTKLVPILSAGTPGVRLGLAQVTGPKLRVRQVRAVLQIDGDFGGIRAKILVPSNSMTSLDRVQGTAVTAVAQYSLLGFSSHHNGRSYRDYQQPADHPRWERGYCPPAHEYHSHHDRGHHYGWYKHHGHHDRDERGD